MNNKYNKEDLERMILEEKLSYEEIGRKYGVSGNCIKKWAKKLGIELQSRRTINPKETFNININNSKYIKSDLEKYNKQGLSYSEIGKLYGVSGSSIFRIFKKFNILKEGGDRNNLLEYRNDIKSFSKDDFTKIVKNSLSIADVLRGMNLPVNLSLYKYINDKISELKLDISHFTGKNWNQGPKKKPSHNKKSVFSYLVNSDKKLIKTYGLKLKLFEEGVKERKCEQCGITEWNGKPAPLELHHIDGNNKNNSLENL